MLWPHWYVPDTGDMVRVMRAPDDSKFVGQVGTIEELWNGEDHHCEDNCPCTGPYVKVRFLDGSWNCFYDELQEEVEPLVFVFGSNLAGRHGKGAALTARERFGAVYGQGEGFQGGSYAIPTKDAKIQTLPLHAILLAVHRFLDFAQVHPFLAFRVTRVGCGLAGYQDKDIAPFFRQAPSNCYLPNEWQQILAGRAQG